MQFHIANGDSCVPIDRARAVGGLRMYFEKYRPLDFQPGSDGKYVGYVYADQFLPEDYYGLSVCKWGIAAVQARLTAQEETQLASLRGDLLHKQQAQINLCRRPGLGHAMLNLCSVKREGQVYSHETRINYIVTMAAKRAAR